jgi:hypothetical protein
VCQFLDIIILCLKIYLDYFWCIKYQYINIYIKLGKEKGKRKGFSLLARSGGILAQPGAGARRRGQMGPDDPRREGTARRTPWVRAHTTERGGGRHGGGGGWSAAVRTGRR